MAAGSPELVTPAALQSLLRRYPAFHVWLVRAVVDMMYLHRTRDGDPVGSAKELGVTVDKCYTGDGFACEGLPGIAQCHPEITVAAITHLSPHFACCVCSVQPTTLLWEHCGHRLCLDCVWRGLAKPELEYKLHCPVSECGMEWKKDVRGVTLTDRQAALSTASSLQSVACPMDGELNGQADSLIHSNATVDACHMKVADTARWLALPEGGGCGESGEPTPKAKAKFMALPLREAAGQYIGITRQQRTDRQ